MNQSGREITNKIRSDDRVVDDNVIQSMYWDLLQAPDWMMDASCVRYDIENPTEIIDPIEDAYYISENLCPSCPVKNMCTHWGSRFDIHRGVFGGKVFPEGEGGKDDE